MLNSPSETRNHHDNASQDHSFRECLSIVEHCVRIRATLVFLKYFLIHQDKRSCQKFPDGSIQQPLPLTSPTIHPLDFIHSFENSVLSSLLNEEWRPTPVEIVDRTRKATRFLFTRHSFYFVQISSNILMMQFQTLKTSSPHQSIFPILPLRFIRRKTKSPVRIESNVHYRPYYYLFSDVQAFSG